VVPEGRLTTTDVLGVVTVPEFSWTKLSAESDTSTSSFQVTAHGDVSW
jgi:hypothetical protein